MENNMGNYFTSDHDRYDWCAYDYDCTEWEDDS